MTAEGAFNNVNLTFSLFKKLPRPAYNIRMITAKFGGTAITPSNLHFVKRCVSSNHNAVVVSAVGKEHACDVKATDLLKSYGLTRDERFWNAFSDKYRRLVEYNSVDVDVDGLLFEARLRADKNDVAYCMSLGEELSAKIVAKYLSADYIEAEQIVRFGARRLRYDDTVKCIASAFKGVQLAVTGGFYGADVVSRKLFSRGGSDVTGSLCAVATRASLYENWTDSYGVCVANPAKVFDVSTVSSLSYDEMFLLAKAGAEVLHPDAVKPCKTMGIPIKIGNFYNPEGASTLVNNCRSSSPVLSVAERIDSYGNTVTTLLCNAEPYVIARALSDFLRADVKANTAFGKPYLSSNFTVVRLLFQDNFVMLTTDKSVIVPLYKHLKTQALIS